MSEHCVIPSAEDILRSAARIIDAHVEDPKLANALRDVLVGFGTTAFSCDPPRLPPLVTLPALVHAGVTGSGAPASSLCGMAFLLFLGIDLLDDIMDRDVTAYWQGRTPAETVLVATTLMSALPQAALAALDAPVESVVAMQSALAKGLLAMAAGQRADILSIGTSDATPDEVLASVVAKSGEFTGMLARLGALLAGAAAEVVDAYAAWGVAYGAADQLRSDCADLFREPVGNDLIRGVFTYPLACLAESGGDEDREGINAAIREAATDRNCLTLLRIALRQRGILAIANVSTQWYAQQAEAALTRAAPRGPAADALNRMLPYEPFVAGPVEAQT